MDQSKKKFSKSVQNFNNSAHNDDFNDQSEYNRRALSNLSANEKNRKRTLKTTLSLILSQIWILTHKKLYLKHLKCFMSKKAR